jgi:hypothetical protein
LLKNISYYDNLNRCFFFFVMDPYNQHLPASGFPSLQLTAPRLNLDQS